MKCAIHLTKNAAGYCVVCGSFRCEECLTQHEGNWYCQKHYRPIQEQLEHEKKIQEARKATARHALEVHYIDDRIERGVCFALNPKEAEFHLERVDDEGVKTGHISHIRFDTVKYIRNVRRYDPQKDARRPEQLEEGEKIVVEFKDGEVLKAFTLKPYAHREQRFFALLEKGGKIEPIVTLIERTDANFVGTLEEHAERRKKAQQEQQEELKSSGPLSQEESMGDFYFGSHDYESAIKEYEGAIKKYGKTARLKKKLIVSNYNAGIHHIRHHRYPKALEYMQAVLREDPDNAHAKEKSRGLEKRIEKTRRLMEQFTQKGAGSFTKNSGEPDTLGVD